MLPDIPKMLRPAATQTTKTLRTSHTPKPRRLFRGSLDAALAIFCPTKMPPARVSDNENGGFADANPP